MTGDANIPQDDWRQDAAEHQNAKQQISQLAFSVHEARSGRYLRVLV